MLVVTAVAAMAVLAVAFGVFLALASRVFAKSEDERVQWILDCLPGANCGACGFGGCRAYAEGIVGGADVGLCRPGGREAIELIASIMGVQAQAAATMRAVVHCQGGTGNCVHLCDYEGQQDCRAAHITSGGPGACTYGCLGFGTCAQACPFGAITMSRDRLPIIDAQKCTACGICVQVCPRDLISLLDTQYKTYLGCSTRSAGKEVKNICQVGCIACGLCARKDPNEAVVMERNLPVLDYQKAAGDFRVAAEVCPMNCFVVEQPALAAVGAAEGQAEEA